MIGETSMTPTPEDQLISRIASLEAQAQIIEGEVHAFKQEELKKATVRIDTKMVDKLRNQILNQ